MNFLNLKEQYLKNGFFIVRNFFSEEDLGLVLKDIFSQNDVETYYDKFHNLRRIEKLYDKSPRLLNLNNQILLFLEEVLGEEMIIFKDKFNAKPPGAEGFFAHYDGIFLWDDCNGVKKEGWYEYANDFTNVLIALDESDSSNGTIEVAKKDDLIFNDLFLNTVQNGTPELTQAVEKARVFNKIDLNIGDVVVFNHKCPHRSSSNQSNKDRRILYYTYNKLVDGDHYKRYFSDKKASNPGSKISKALSKV
jgi:2-aminoethylphosphonate dioxygenase